jgi:hypothetical protein
MNLSISLSLSISLYLPPPLPLSLSPPSHPPTYSPSPVFKGLAFCPGDLLEEAQERYVRVRMREWA